jgi:hypothetical protein
MLLTSSAPFFVRSGRTDNQGLEPRGLLTGNEAPRDLENLFFDG